ncbi:MAG TPA: glycosyltransferase family 39 protein [Chthoniobacterales bacterium]|nr:glycosyltransferase family 39 protein [Chthoniobacterales bacterium]
MQADGLRPDRVHWILFLSISVFGFLARLACTTGLIGSDDLAYSRYAQLIAHHQYHPESIHYALRYGLTIPVAVLYGLLGVHEWTTFLLPLIASTASVPVLMIIGARLVGPRAGLLAGVLLASFPVSLFYATILVPEPVAGLYVLLALLLYTETERRAHPEAFALVAGLTLGISYVTKESAAFVVIAVVLDALLRKKWTVALGVSAGALAIVAAEYTYYLVATGDLLYRFHAMKMHEQSAMVLAVNQNLGYRLLKSYPRLMLLPNLSFGLHSTFTLVLLLGLFKWRPSRTPLLLLWAIVPLLYLNFGSSSLTHFTALPVADRYLEFCYPPLFLLAGAVMDRWTTQPVRPVRALCAALTCTAVVAAVGFGCAYASHQKGWLTRDIAVLRKIAEAANQKHAVGLRFVADPDNRWKQSMAIIAPELHVLTEEREAGLVIGPDALGLPSAMTSAPVGIP